MPYDNKLMNWIVYFSLSGCWRFLAAVVETVETPCFALMEQWWSQFNIMNCVNKNMAPKNAASPTKMYDIKNSD